MSPHSGNLDALLHMSAPYLDKPCSRACFTLHLKWKPMEVPKQEQEFCHGQFFPLLQWFVNKPFALSQALSSISRRLHTGVRSGVKRLPSSVFYWRRKHWSIKLKIASHFRMHNLLLVNVNCCTLAFQKVKVEKAPAWSMFTTKFLLGITQEPEWSASNWSALKIYDWT